MAKRPTIDVTADELDAVFVALDIWLKIADGRLSMNVVARTSAPSRSFPGGTSSIIQHRNRAGYHVATTHRITLADGPTPHWHAKDLHLGDIVIWRSEG